LKNTRLDDNAAIYNHKERKTEKEKWSSLSARGKLQYFKDYYLKFVILGLVLFVVIVSLFSSILTKKETVFTLTVVNSSMSDKAIESLGKSLSKRLELNTKKEEVVIDQSLYTNDATSVKLSDVSEQKLSVFSYSGQYDMIIADRSIFEHYAAFGSFCNLEELLPIELNDAFSGSYVYAAVNDTTVNVANGISIKDFKAFDPYTKNMSDPVLALFVSSKHTDNSILFLDNCLEN